MNFDPIRVVTFNIYKERLIENVYFESEYLNHISKN